MTLRSGTVWTACSHGFHKGDLGGSPGTIADDIGFTVERVTTLALTGLGYKWTASGSGTNEYYLEALAGGDPGVSEPAGLTESGTAMSVGTMGSLAAGEWDWGDNDALGYSTVYVRTADGVDPDTLGGAVIQTTTATGSIIRLSFTAPSDADFVQAVAHRSTSPNFTTRTAVCTFTESDVYDDTGLATNTRYYYQCGALDNDDTTVAPAPQRVASTSAGGSDELSTYEHASSRNCRYKGKRFMKKRVLHIPKGDVESLYDHWKCDHGNIDPDYAAEWDGSTDYAVGDRVRGDGVNDTYAYECILAHEVSDEGAQRPPNTTYWKRLKFAPYIIASKKRREMLELPGYSELILLYNKPTAREILRQNANKAILEVKISAEAAEVLRESEGPPKYDADKTYAIGERVAYANKGTWATATGYSVADQVWGDGSPDANGYECIKAHTSSASDEPPNAEYWRPVLIQPWVCIQSGSGKTPSSEPTYWRASSNIIKGIEIGRKWDGSVTYQIGDIVWQADSGDNGYIKTYRCKVPSTNNSPAADTGTYWKVVEAKWISIDGKNIEFTGKGVIRLLGVSDDFDLDDYVYAIGHTNNSALSAFGTFAAKGTLLFYGYESKMKMEEGALAEVAYYFLFDPRGWQNNAFSRRLRKIVREEPVLDANGDDSGKTSRVVSWVPDHIHDEVPTERREVGKGELDFSAFNLMLTW
jgi:hypothetical protein